MKKRKKEIQHGSVWVEHTQKQDATSTEYHLYLGRGSWLLSNGSATSAQSFHRQMLMKRRYELCKEVGTAQDDEKNR